MAEHPSSLLLADQLIIDRLRAELPADIAVDSMINVAEIDYSEWDAPAVFVIYGGHTIISNNGPVVLLEQQWHVVPVVDNIASMKEGTEAKDEGGELAASCIAALHDWQPDSRLDPLQLSDGQPVDFFPGRAFFPLAFKTRVTMQGCTDCNDDY